MLTIGSARAHLRRPGLLPAAAAATALAAVAAVSSASTTASAAPVSPAAFESAPIGWGGQNGGTTGGAGGSSVTVTTASALDSALQSSSAMTIHVSGMISLSGMHKVAANKSVLGLGSNSGLTGGGLNVASVHNVIIRNLVLKNADDDSINVQYSTNVWIDHNDLSNGHDGLVDIKRSSDFITVSWNHFHNHDKTALLGHDDNNQAEDLGHLRVTYHHNWFDATTQRHPRVRFGNPVHVYNNYYVGNSGYGIASTCNAGVLSEHNYFENVAHPTVIQTGDSPDGNLKVSGDFLTGSGAEQTRNSGSVAAIPYSYTADPAANVKSIVTSGAGTGKVGL
ncbi:MAG: polysaccharide lyase family 1 protein [Mycobacteriales bacterium]